MARFDFDDVLICGVGLIGGSLARALREAHQSGRASGRGRLIGADPDRNTLVRALALGVIDTACLLPAAGTSAVAETLPATRTVAPPHARSADAGFMSFDDAVARADLIVLAAPVAQTGSLLARIAPRLRADATVTDVGSTKGEVCDAARAALGVRDDRFVAGHPIAGAAASGVDAGSATLFEGRDAIVCPTAACAADALARVTAMWRVVGARPVQMTAARHDAIFATVSHLPHLLAFAFITHILEQDDPDERFALAGSGFRDFSRIAASNPEMWRDICLANRDALLAELDHYAATVAVLRDAVANGDGETLQTLFSRARDARADWREGETRAARTERRLSSGHVVQPQKI